ncbi:DUF1552 domain-containing protein [Lignipirellula cremea]|uniref:DUF1552 domain-containing protein n=1 Tax=Lignipirellula cremea TaxID=2528010 RepID=A0A518DNZ6_9BACT|nr:DUF1552 domain-containing protein [Lignipirellula cremea]QDU93554.1 hypothetical protein Pla8534_13340 [Lignipirellula cremea]
MPTNRRQFLQSSALAAGALTMTPSLAALQAASASDIGPRRFIFIRKSNGIRPQEVALPTFSEAEKKQDDNKQPLEVDLHHHELPPWLRELEGDKQQMAILQGLSCKMSENGHWSYSSVMGAFKSGRNSLSGIKRATIDFELARLFPSPFGHVELSLTGNYSTFRTGIVAGYSAPGPHQRNYCYADPQTAYNELFKSVTDPGAVDSDNAMLAFLEGEELVKASVLGGYEKLKLSNHIASLEEIQGRNKQLKSLSAVIRQHLPEIAPVHAGGGPNASTPEKQQAMTDILTAALATGLTNVVTYTIDELSTPIKGIPGNESDHISIHELGHNGGYSGVSAEKIREKIRVGHVRQIRTIIDKLKAIPEGNGNMFDNTVILYFPENGETHHSQGVEAPVVVMAGDNCRLNMLGRYIRLPHHGTEGHKTIGNWYTTLLNAYGNPIEHYGDLDLEMSRKKLDQTGAIRQFLGQIG